MTGFARALEVLQRYVENGGELDQSPAIVIDADARSTATGGEGTKVAGGGLKSVPTPADLADGSVTSAQIGDGTITTSDLAGGAVTSIKIADSAVGGTQLASGDFRHTNPASGNEVGKSPAPWPRSGVDLNPPPLLVHYRDVVEMELVRPRDRVLTNACKWVAPIIHHLRKLEKSPNIA